MVRDPFWSRAFCPAEQPLKTADSNQETVSWRYYMFPASLPLWELYLIYRMLNAMQWKRRCFRRRDIPLTPLCWWGVKTDRIYFPSRAIGKVKIRFFILQVNGVDITGRTQEELVAMLRSTKLGDTVSLIVGRQEDFMPRELVRFQTFYEKWVVSRNNSQF